MLTEGEYTVRYIDMPDAVKAMTSMDESGFYNVYINTRLSFDEQKRALKHELKHVARDDAANGRSIRAVEHI